MLKRLLADILFPDKKKLADVPVPTDFSFPVRDPEALRHAIDAAFEAVERLLATEAFSAAAQLLDQLLVASPRDPRALALFSRFEVPYDSGFYSTWLPGMLSSGQHMLGKLFQYHRFPSIIDFGAGAGAWLTAAAQHGASRLVALEGEWVKNFHSELIEPSIEYRHGDLNDAAFLASVETKGFDLAICVEVAEHVHPDNSAALVRAICRSAATVVFGAALPRQWGNGHINCRSQRFWIDLFAENGFRCVDFFRPDFWFHPVVAHWYAQNTFLFVSPESPGSLRDYVSPLLLDAYHPGTVNPFVIADHQRGRVDPADV